MSSKVDRAIHGPSWAEVILGAVLSLLLGVVLGAVLLVLKPVIVAKEPAKEPVAGAVYYIEGSRDGSKAKQALAKRKAFVEGQSIKTTEEEINSLIGAVPVASAKPGEKPAEAPAQESGALAAGTPNVRIRGGNLQVGVPLTVNLLGLGQKIIVQARGGFVKDGDIFVFKPDEMYLGSCPVQRLPFVAGYVRNKFISSQPIPEDIVATWSKLANVSIEGNTLNLTMQ